ncbi:MAG: site-specific integrase [Candidatus Aminicenantes bacterium]|nr:site-specific integrase [Candidatus Aminicenantes bacterium]
MPKPQPADACPTDRHSGINADAAADLVAESSFADAPGRVVELAAASLSKNTRRAYRGALQRLQHYLDKHDASLTDGWLASYLASLFHRGRSPSSASMVVAAVRFQARTTGTPSPVGPATDRVLAGFRREGRRRGRGQVEGISWEMADVIAALITAVETGSLAAFRDAALISIMSDAMLRVSEVAALRCADIREDDGGAGLLTIRSSKTDQEGEGTILFLGALTMRRIRAWITAAGFNSGPLFRAVRVGGIVEEGPLSSRSIRNVIQKRAKQAGIDAGRISGHSLRVGSAQSLALRGASLVELQQAGRWTSPHMPGRYVRGQLASRGPVARIRYGKGS